MNLSHSITQRRNTGHRSTGWIIAAALATALVWAAPTPTLAQASAVPAVKAPQVDKPKRVLMVGNSYYYYNNSLHNHLRRMVEAAGIHAERELQYKSSTIGGASLDHHPIDWLTTPGRIGIKDGFELVVLQGGSGEPLSPARADKFVETVKAADQIIRARGGRTALYMTHAYTPAHRDYKPDQQRTIEAVYLRAGNEVGALVIPVGLAFEEAYKRHPELALHDKDATHPSLLGTYLGACTAFAAIYGQSPVGNRYTYNGAVDEATARKLQQVAQDVVTAFYKR